MSFAGWRRTWGLRVFADARFARLAVAVVVALVLAYRACQVLGWSAAPQWGYDFSAYWLAGRHLLNGEPIYTAAQLAGEYVPQGQFLYLYPPFLAVLAIPFAWLSPGAYGPAAGLWFLGGAAITVAVVLGIARLERLPPARGRLRVPAARRRARPGERPPPAGRAACPRLVGSADRRAPG